MTVIESKLLRIPNVQIFDKKIACPCVALEVETVVNDKQ